MQVDFVMYKVHDPPPIQPKEGSISTNVTADTADIGTAGMLKSEVLSAAV
jgi:hypothetical protein